MQLSEVMVNRDVIEPALEQARQGIAAYLESALSEGRIDQQLYAEAERQTYTNLKQWLTDEDIGRLCPNLKPGILGVIKNERWEWIVNAFRQSVRFGTGGIRGMMAFDRESIVRLKDSGIDAPILKGPNTINDLVMLLTSAGVARFGKAQNPPLAKDDRLGPSKEIIISVREAAL